MLDYNTNFKSAGQIVSLFAPDQFRTSDHDPVVVGLHLDGNVDVAVVAVPILLWPPNHTLRSVTVVAVDRRLRLQRVDILRTTSSEADSGLGEGDLPGDIVPVDHDTVKLRAERFGRFGRTYTIDVIVTQNHQAVSIRHSRSYPTASVRASEPTAGTEPRVRDLVSRSG